MVRARPRSLAKGQGHTFNSAFYQIDLQCDFESLRNNTPENQIDLKCISDFFYRNYKPA